MFMVFRGPTDDAMPCQRHTTQGLLRPGSRRAGDAHLPEAWGPRWAMVKILKKGNIKGLYRVFIKRLPGSMLGLLTRAQIGACRTPPKGVGVDVRQV